MASNFLMNQGQILLILKFHTAERGTSVAEGTHEEVSFLLYVKNVFLWWIFLVHSATTELLLGVVSVLTLEEFFWGGTAVVAS